MNPRALLLFSLILPAVAGCGTPIEYEDTWLDSPFVQDPSLADSTYRVSARPGLTLADRARPVIIAAHGFTGSTYEWTEFRDYAEQRSEVLVSLVLLGGHGRTIEEFEQSTWQEWGRPILDEYHALIEQGYTQINLAGSSTGGALILEQIHQGAYDGQPPEHFFFIDPIVVPGNKLLTLASVLGPIVGNLPQDLTPEEEAHWYTNRPAKALIQLNKLCNRVRSALTDGVSLPAGAHAKVFKTARDETADPVSALLIYKGLRDAMDRRIEVEMIDSDLHVFTRLQGRNPLSYDASDRERQQRTFEEMTALALQRGQ